MANVAEGQWAGRTQAQDISRQIDALAQNQFPRHFPEGVLSRLDVARGTTCFPVHEGFATKVTGCFEAGQRERLRNSIGWCCFIRFCVIS